MWVGYSVLQYVIKIPFNVRTSSCVSEITTTRLPNGFNTPREIPCGKYNLHGKKTKGRAASPCRVWPMSGEASPPSRGVVGPSLPWRLAERRSRKAGAGNIFGGVSVWQLQRLFQASGDQDAERRAQLVWGHVDEAQLAHALMGLREQGPRRTGRRSEGRGAVIGSRWLRAFKHLRIRESSPSGQEREPGDQSDPEVAEDKTQTAEEPVVGSSSTVGHSESQYTCERPARVGPVRRRGLRNSPQRYLHRILH